MSCTPIARMAIVTNCPNNPGGDHVMVTEADNVTSCARCGKRA